MTKFKNLHLLIGKYKINKHNNLKQLQQENCDTCKINCSANLQFGDHAQACITSLKDHLKTFITDEPWHFLIILRPSFSASLFFVKKVKPCLLSSISLVFIKPESSGSSFSSLHLFRSSSKLEGIGMSSLRVNNFPSAVFPTIKPPRRTIDTMCCKAI